MPCDELHEFLDVLSRFDPMTGREVKQEVGVNDLGLLPRSFVTMSLMDPNCSQLDTEFALEPLVEKITELRE